MTTNYSQKNEYIFCVCVCVQHLCVSVHKSINICIQVYRCSLYYRYNLNLKLFPNRKFKEKSRGMVNTKLSKCGVRGIRQGGTRMGARVFMVLVTGAWLPLLRMLCNYIYIYMWQISLRVQNKIYITLERRMKEKIRLCKLFY